MPYPAISIANSFLRLAKKEGRGIDPMKIQKLCYLAHGYYLVEKDKALLDEKFEAWKFGPVLPSLYHAAKRYGKSAIPKYFEDYDHEAGEYYQPAEPTDEHIRDIIQFVWENYGSKHAMELSDWTHEKGGPWDRVIESEDTFIRNKDIPDDLIADYFNRTMYNDH